MTRKLLCLNNGFLNTSKITEHENDYEITGMAVQLSISVYWTASSRLVWTLGSDIYLELPHTN